MPRRSYSAGEAARRLGISVDTLRRWDRQGRIRTRRDSANRRIVPASEIERLRGGERRLTVFAAASLTEVFEELQPNARYNFAGSDELATQLREGAGADVYAAASPKYPIELHDEGLVEQPRAFATNRLG